MKVIGKVGLLGWIFLVVTTLSLAALIRSAVFESFRIPSESMLPTLMPGDYIFVGKYELGFDPLRRGERLWVWREPERGDCVVFALLGDRDNTESRFIKRIVGLPGDVVEVENFVAYVNGQVVDKPGDIRRSNEPQTVAEHRGRWGPVTLGPDEYFVLGDNRVNSEDSRYHGPIRREDIEGRAIFVYWSLEEGSSFWPRWERIGRRIH